MQSVKKELFCDVAVIGGGVGGCAAAIEAARRGQHVILFEKGVSLGGLATNGYVPQVAGNIEGICLEFVQRMEQCGQFYQRPEDVHGYHNPSFDPEIGKIVLEDMLFQAGARIIYDSTCMDVEMDGRNIKKAFFHTKGGVMSVSADIFIDGTGDADLASMAGAPYEVGGQDFAGLNASTTLGSRWSGADLVKYQEAEDKYREEQRAQGAKRILPLVYVLEEAAIKRGELVRHVCNPFAGFFRVRLPGYPDNNADFVTFSFHSYYCHNTDAEDISRQILEQHQLMRGFLNFLRAEVPGFENVRLVGTGSLPGVRDSRRIFGEYMLKETDIACGSKFDDGIARFPGPFDTHHPTSDRLVFIRHIHMTDPTGSAVTLQSERGCPAAMHPFGDPIGIEVRPDPRDYCDIPYRCLLPRNVDNLLATGRCCSAEFHANGAMRIIGPAMSTGQAAGVAADLALKEKIRPRDLDGKRIRQILIDEDGVPLDKPCDGHWARYEGKPGRHVIARGDMCVFLPEGETPRRRS